MRGIIEAIEIGDTIGCLLLLDDAEDVDMLYPFTHERTILMQACCRNMLLVVEKLLVLGADPDKKDFDGWTALHYSTYLSRLECIKLLLKHGASIDTKNNYGYTPPCIAKEWGHLSTVRLLHGTKPY